MNKRKIIESGLLELHVMGCLDASDSRVVDLAIKKFPELRHEIYDIEQALFVYANKFAAAPSANLKSEILSQLNKSQPLKIATDTSKPVIKTTSNYLIPFILAVISSLGLLLLHFSTNSKINTLQEQAEMARISCDSINDSNLKMQKTLHHLRSPNNKILNVDPTEGYPGTKLIIHNNPKTKKNFLQLENMPPLAENQSYQLWSLKDGSDPMPLDVFEGNRTVFEVTYVAGTKAYAITVESKGGNESPDLTKLIGVIPVS